VQLFSGGLKYVAMVIILLMNAHQGFLLVIREFQAVLVMERVLLVGMVEMTMVGFNAQLHFLA